MYKNVYYLFIWNIIVFLASVVSFRYLLGLLTPTNYEQAFHFAFAFFILFEITCIRTYLINKEKQHGKNITDRHN